MRAAWKVGLFVVFFAGLAVTLLLFMRVSVFGKRFSTYYAKFGDAGGVIEGSAVMQSGVRVGQVARVQFADDGQVMVKLDIFSGHRIPAGTTASIPGSIISLGERQLVLNVPKSSSGVIQPDNEDKPIPGVAINALDGLLPGLDTTMEQVNKTLVAVQDLLGDEELRGGLSNMLSTGAETTAKFGEVADTLNSTLARSGRGIDSMMASMARTLRNLEDVSVSVRRITTDGKLEAQANELLATVGAAAKEGKALVEDLHSMTNDPEMKASLKETMANFQSMSESGKKMAQDGEIITANGVDASQQAKEILAKANKLADEVAKLVSDVKGKVDDVVPGATRNLIPSVGIDGDLSYDTNTKKVRSDVTLRVPAGKETLLLGMYDAFESNKLTLQLEKSLNSRTDLRYGVYASRPGVGVSYEVAPNLVLRGDLYGLNDPRMDVRLRYDVSTGNYVWVGVDKLLGRNSVSLGVGIKR